MGKFDEFSQKLDKIRFYFDDFNGIANVEEDDEFIIVETHVPNDWLTSYSHFFRLERHRSEDGVISKYWMRKLELE